MSKYLPQDHTFILCAYGESPYLEECVRSLLHQQIITNVAIATSTPNEWITGIAKKYRLPVFVRVGEEKGIAADWNYAMSCSDTALVTLAHQDDLYSKTYSKEILKALNKSRHPLIAFSDYGEVRSGQTVMTNTLLRIKRMLLIPLLLPAGGRSRFWRRRALSLGNPICCPAVTYVQDHLQMPIFENNMKSNIDWQAWERISREKGEFVYVAKPLMLHRIHEESTTSQLIEEDGRGEEDMQVLRKFWPSPLAALIERFYKKSEQSNEV